MNQEQHDNPFPFVVVILILAGLIGYFVFFNWQRNTAKKTNVVLIEKNKSFHIFQFPDGTKISRKNIDSPKMEVGTTGCYFQTRHIGDGIEPGLCPEEDKVIY